MGHAEKHIIFEVDERSASHPPLKRPLYMFLLHSKQKKSIFCKLLKVVCDICATKTLVERGSNSIYCKNCDHKMFVK